MSVSKVDFFEKLIDGYVKVPPSFQEQAITTLAILLCQKNQLKNIKYEPDDMCQRLPLPPAIKSKLISRIPLIASQLDDWNRRQDVFDLPPLFVKSCLKTSDWTVVEMRLDEKKIATRIVQDERIPVCQRYRMACFHFIEDIIPSLWRQISPDIRSDLFLREKLELVKLWCLHLDRDFEELLPRNKEFWFAFLRVGVWDGSVSSVLQCWDKLDINVREEGLEVIATNAMSVGFRDAADTDIFCFLLTQISKERRAELFQEIFQNPENHIFSFFLKWLYLDLFAPIIKELWNILPEVQYMYILDVLTITYCDAHNALVTHGYMNYEYGNLIIKLLEETPDRFKRYVFGNNYPFADSGILYTLLNEGHHKLHYKEVFKHIWKHVTLEEKRLFLRSDYGLRFCSNLATEDNWDLLNSILRECFPEDEIHTFMKKLQV